MAGLALYRPVGPWYMVQSVSGVPVMAWPWVHHPGYTMAMPPSTGGSGSGHPANWKCAMGSKVALRNSQMGYEVNLEPTICLLAAILGACCKNHLVPKAPRYLDLSNPGRILLRVGPLP